MAANDPNDLNANPVPSPSFVVAERNASDLDQLINQTGFVTNRAGNMIASWQQAIANLGFEIPVSYALGIIIERRSQTFVYQNQTYHYVGATLPFTTVTTQPTGPNFVLIPQIDTNLFYAGVHLYRNDINYVSNQALVFGSDGSIYRCTQNSGPASAVVNPVTDSDSSHWVLSPAGLNIGTGDNDIPTNSTLPDSGGGGYNVGDLVLATTDAAPAGTLALDGSTIVNGVGDFPDLAASGSRFITVTSQNIVLANAQDFIRGKGSSPRAVGEFQLDTVGSHGHAVSISGASSYRETLNNSSQDFFATGALTIPRLSAPTVASSNLSVSVGSTGSSQTSPRYLTSLICIYHGVTS